MSGTPLAALDRFFATWRFPVLALSTCAVTGLSATAMLLWPSSGGAVGQFAEDFRTWCFGYNAATGEMDRTQVFIFLSQPVLIGGLVAALWWDLLRRVSWRAALPWALGGLGLVGVSTVALADIRLAPGREAEIPFPAEALRTRIPAPTLSGLDQEGQPFDLRDVRGEVVVITAVYASCGFTCPTLFAQAKAALATLSTSELEHVRVVGLTLDANRDRPEVLARLAAAQGIGLPTYRLLTGSPRLMDTQLDRLGVTRTRDPVTGVIDHANLFIVVDREGYIAYRFTLGERQARWLAAALRLLVAE
ncbi:MAG: SCO family protein [Deltaproteobacteria bacterium]|nr:SCO family protein [Deltaproteobacteria bacterium]